MLNFRNTFIFKYNIRRICKRHMVVANGFNGDAVKLSYLSQNKLGENGVANPIIVLHGLFGSKKNWESMSKAMSQSLCRQVIAVDCRNHGASPHVEEMNHHVMSEDIVKLMADLSIPQADIIGHSMGGKVAMVLALTKPDLVSSLIVADVSPTVERTASSTSFPTYINAMRNVRMNSSLTLPEVRKSVSKQLEHVLKKKDELNFILTNVIKEAGNYRWQVNLDSIGNNLDYIVGFPSIDKKYEKKSLFIAGGMSEHIKEKNHQEIKALFPNASITTIENAGHWVHAQQPYEFLSRVKSFLKGGHL